jgi:hypothetical protein
VFAIIHYLLIAVFLKKNASQQQEMQKVATFGLLLALQEL